MDWHLSKCHPSTKMAGARSSCGGFQDQSFAFQDWKYADKRHKWKEKVQWNAQFPFCGQTKDFAMKLSFEEFNHGSLACFEPSKAARIRKKLEVHSVCHGQGKYVFKREYLYLKKFHGRFLHFDIGVKENHKMCIWNWIAQPERGGGGGGVKNQYLGMGESRWPWPCLEQKNS